LGSCYPVTTPDCVQPTPTPFCRRCYPPPPGTKKGQS
jgi:hypothetical protein